MNPKAGSTPLPVLILFGPTASGKTALAERLFTGANALCRAEVISADSMQVYRGMDIGTAKPELELQKILPHHLIDIRNPDEQFNAGDFVRLADKACLDIKGRSALPVILGGTGFYLKNFMYGLPASPPADKALRDTLKKELEENGAEALAGRLRRLDPASAERIHANDAYRLLRALEVCISSGLPLGSFTQGKTLRKAYRFLIVGLHCSREDLYSRINDRCEAMFRRGLSEEVRGLFYKGYTPDDPGLRAIGYREFFVKNDSRWSISNDKEGVKALIAQNSRRYAKRQETFFRAIPNAALEAKSDVRWLSVPAQKAGAEAFSGGEGRSALDLLSSFIHTELNLNP